MPVISTRINPTQRAVTIITELDATPSQVWQLWSDPGRLANWWGPPGHPMTITHHDLRAGGTISFHVTIADATFINAGFYCSAVRPFESLALVFTTDGLDEPSDIKVAIEPVDEGRTHMTIVASYRTDRALQQALEVGFDEGLRRSVARADTAVGDR
jgi:uncharacterized protein YndB with AHSA1/START domain